MTAAVKPWHARTGRHLGWALVAACLLAAGRLVEAQSAQGKITVTSPDSDTRYAGESIVVAFNASGDAVYGPYDIDLLKGNYEVQNWCSSTAGCDIDSVAEDGYALVPVDLSSTHEPGVGYTVRVTDRNSSISGSTFPFQVLAALPSNSSEAAMPEYRDEVGGAAGVEDMGLAMVVVATICGAALSCTLLAACFLTCRRRATKKIKDLENAQDIELGGSHGRTTPGRTNDSSSSDSRGFSSGQAVKTPVRTRGGSQGQYTPTRLSRGDGSGHIYPSPGRAMAMGEHQRGRSLSRTSSGPQMYSTTPGRRRGTSASPGQGSRREYEGTPGRGRAIVAVTPVRGGSGGSRRGRQMYDSSRAPSWDDGGRRMSSRSPGLTRSTSAGRTRRPPRSASQEYAGEYNSRGYGRQDSSGLRRSKSERYERSPSHDWARQHQEQRWGDRDMVAAGGEVERGRGSLAQRSGSGVSAYTRSKSMHNVSERGRSGSPGNHVLGRSASVKSRSRSNTPSRQRAYNSGMPANGSDMPPDVSWEELRSTYLKNNSVKTRSGIRKSYSLPSYGDAIGDNRPPPPSYGSNDAANSKGLSIGIPDDPKPGSFRSVKSARGARHTVLSGPLGSTRTSSSASKSSGRFGSSPGTRAVSARKAARDAQLSAERALAAAAMASRAADLAAQAALEAEAEAEADAELVGDGSDEDVDDDVVDEVQMSPPSKSSSGGSEAQATSSSVREKIKVFSGGNSLGGSSSSSGEKNPARSPLGSALSRGWSQADEKEVKARAEQSSVKAKEALASIGRSTSGAARPDNSWVKEAVRGPDTAGGSSHDGKADAAADAAAAAGAPPEALVLHSDAELLAMKRKAFVKQYSQGVTSDVNDDDNYLLHDNAAAVAIAAIIGKQGTPVSSGQGDYTQPQFADGKNPGTPKRGRSPTPVDLDGSDVDERTRVRRRPSPGPSYTVAKEVHIHTVEHASVLNMSDSGSPRPELV